MALTIGRAMSGQSDVTGTKRRGLVEVRLTGSDDVFGTMCCDTWTVTEASVDRSKRSK
ncbi:hypothetical protein DPMN_192972 [Dreissena polymorpha]|uniref:SRCR domain-containing protein n=1 Tax=Dreissena polymorpha TaxID=45954 RepID=A0A9D3Y158_DREPO|nr:hypothetical protein DPMN_192972 [Dreissena polymorpha]